MGPGNQTWILFLQEQRVCLTAESSLQTLGFLLSVMYDKALGRVTYHSTHLVAVYSAELTLPSENISSFKNVIFQVPL